MAQDLTTLVIFMTVLQINLFLFAGQTPDNTALWNLATNPAAWNSLAFLGDWVVIAIGIGITGAFIGSISGLKTDFMVFSTMIAGILTLGFPLVGLSGVISKEMGAIFCGGAILSGCPPAIVVIALTVGPLSIYYVMTVVAWWRGRA